MSNRERSGQHEDVRSTPERRQGVSRDSGDMEYRPIDDQCFPLPSDVLRMKMHGDFSGAQAQVGQWLSRPFLPSPLKRRLLLEHDLLRLPMEREYPYSAARACEILRSSIAGFQDDELDDLRNRGSADWIFIGGEIRYSRRFFENIVKTLPAYAARLLAKDDSGEANKRLLDENVRIMKENGGRSARILIHSVICPVEEKYRPQEDVLVHLPLVRAARQVSDVQILSMQPSSGSIAPEDTLQRTVSFTSFDPGIRGCGIEYSYRNTLAYVEPDAALVEGREQPSFDTGEQRPHIVFTPYLKALTEEIIGDEGNPLRKARLIYDFITRRVMYSFMPPYAAVDCISEYAAVNLKGDCGVQAILFIALCRLCGIPARWQSGLYVTPTSASPHDWAQFYVAPYGWLFADLSFGGSAWRAGKPERWNYYFGNLDVFRMPANDGLQSEFNPQKRFRRNDPTDNQTGEIEYGDRPLGPEEAVAEHTVKEFTFL